MEWKRMEENTEQDEFLEGKYWIRVVTVSLVFTPSTALFTHIFASINTIAVAPASYVLSMSTI